MFLRDAIPLLSTLVFMLKFYFRNGHCPWNEMKEQF